MLVTSAGSANGGGYDAILGFDAEGEPTGPFSNDARIVDPRGLSVDPSGALVYLNSGDDRVLALDRLGEVVRDSGRIPDPELSPLDLTLAPNGHIVVASERPFGAPHAVAGIREYDPTTGELIRVFAPDRSLRFRRPRGLRFGPGGRLYCVGEDHVVAFDFATGSFLGPVVRLRRLNGQALVLSTPG